MAQETVFEGSLQWAGPRPGQAFSYDSFDRTTQLQFAGGAQVQASAPAEFNGDDALCNPETLMLASLMQCHFLTFMAVASKSGATVLSYRDAGSGRLAIGKIIPESSVLGSIVPSIEPVIAARWESVTAAMNTPRARPTSA